MKQFKPETEFALELQQQKKAVEDLRNRIEQHSNEAAIEAEANKIWLVVEKDTRVFIIAALMVILLIGAGVMGGAHLFPPHPQGSQALDPQFQQILMALIPGIMLVLTVFIGVVGLKRLQLYDAEIREARKEQREQMKDAQRELRMQTAEARQEIIAQMDSAARAQRDQSKET
jgi:hypothetical protein